MRTASRMTPKARKTYRPREHAMATSGIIFCPTVMMGIMTELKEGITRMGIQQTVKPENPQMITIEETKIIRSSLMRTRMMIGSHMEMRTKTAVRRTTKHPAMPHMSNRHTLQEKLDAEAIIGGTLIHMTHMQQRLEMTIRMLENLLIMGEVRLIGSHKIVMLSRKRETHGPSGVAIQ